MRGVVACPLDGRLALKYETPNYMIKPIVPWFDWQSSLKTRRTTITACMSGNFSYQLVQQSIMNLNLSIESVGLKVIMFSSSV